MRYLAAYLLLVVGGNSSPSSNDIKRVIESVGIEADEDRISKLLSELEGKDINVLIAEGAAKFASVPTGGAVAASGTAATPAAAAAAAAPVEEKKEEEKEESDDDMGFGLFD